MVAKSRLLNDMIMDISYNVVGKHDEDIITEETAYGAPKPAVQPNGNGSSRSGPSTTTTASHPKRKSPWSADSFPALASAVQPNGNRSSQSGSSTATTASHSNRTSLSSIDDFPALAPAKNPLKPFPTNPKPFDGLAKNTLRMQPVSIPAPAPAPTPAPIMEPLPPPVKRCSSALCNIESFHEAKRYSVQDNNRPKYVKQLEERLERARARGIKVENWWEVEFLNVFYSVHWAGGAMVVPA